MRTKDRKGKEPVALTRIKTHVRQCPQGQRDGVSFSKPGLTWFYVLTCQSQAIQALLPSSVLPGAVIDDTTRLKFGNRLVSFIGRLSSKISSRSYRTPIMPSPGP